jgi:oxygen-independent coproporphyrinogen-3 oxidase
MSLGRPEREPRPGIYIHIPYCVKKCVYCSFNSYETACGVPAAYVEALTRDIEKSSPGWDGVEFGSVYFGGGTPSLLEPEDLAHILSEVRLRLRLSPDAEITLESNPASLDRSRLSGFREAGLNRLSVGVQSLAPSELRLLGRLHSRDEAMRSLESARAEGFSNLSCDIMLGIPGQTVASLEQTLSEVVPLASHISCYLLSVDPGTPLRTLVDEGTVSEEDDETVIMLLEAAAGSLTRQGFRRYEISNWARPGFECGHNAVYWSRGDYLGLGAGASSHRCGARSRRIEHPDDYNRAVLSGGDPVSFRETVAADDTVAEEIMLRLRTIRGLDLDRLAGEYGCDLEKAGPLLNHLCGEGLVVRNGKEIQLTAKGILVSDAVIADLTFSLTA